MAAFPMYISYALVLDENKWVRGAVLAAEYLLGIVVMTVFLMNGYIM